MRHLYQAGRNRSLRTGSSVYARRASPGLSNRGTERAKEPPWFRMLLMGALIQGEGTWLRTEPNTSEYWLIIKFFEKYCFDDHRLNPRWNRMYDQASTLKRSRQGYFPATAENELVGHQLVAIAITSGKGGVGKTNVVANRQSHWPRWERVLILDADFGLANIDVLFGLAPSTTWATLCFR